MQEVEDPRGVTRTLRGNETLVLDDPAVAWDVQHGNLAVFAVRQRDDEPAGPRRYLFTLGAGETLFGFGRDDGPALRVIAVALEESTLRGAEPQRAWTINQRPWLARRDSRSLPGDLGDRDGRPRIRELWRSVDPRALR